MRIGAALLVAASLLSSCSSSSHLTISLSKDADRTRFQSESQGSWGVVSYRDQEAHDRTEDGEGFILTSDSLTWRSLETTTLTAQPLERVGHVRLIKSSGKVLGGTLIGASIGFLGLFALAASADGDFRMESPALVGIGGAVAGGFAGLLWSAASTEHVHVEFVP